MKLLLKKTRLLANIKLEEFLRKTIVLNIISLTKTNEVIAKKIDATNYSNYYSIINNTIDVS